MQRLDIMTRLLRIQLQFNFLMGLSCFVHSPDIQLTLMEETEPTSQQQQQTVITYYADNCLLHTMQFYY